MGFSGGNRIGSRYLNAYFQTNFKFLTHGTGKRNSASTYYFFNGNPNFFLQIWIVFFSNIYGIKNFYYNFKTDQVGVSQHLDLCMIRV